MEDMQTTYSRHLSSITAKSPPRISTPTQDEIKTNSHVFSRPVFVPVNSTNSMPLSRGCGFGSHINVAKQGCESLFGDSRAAVFGKRNDGKGGGGIDSMESGGGGALNAQLPTQLPSIVDSEWSAMKRKSGNVSKDSMKV